MKKFAALAAVPLFAGFLFAQSQTSQTTTTTTTSTMDNSGTYTGTLIDAGCYTTRTKDTNTHEEAGSATKTETTKVDTSCPATSESTSFALLTPEGKTIMLDQPGNEQVVQLVKNDRTWQESFSAHRPVKVRVTHDGGKVVIKEIR